MTHQTDNRLAAYGDPCGLGQCLLSGTSPWQIMIFILSLFFPLGAMGDALLKGVCHTMCSYFLKKHMCLKEMAEEKKENPIYNILLREMCVFQIFKRPHILSNMGRFINHNCSF